MNIGNVKITGYAALAPMAGVADRAFRELCFEFGAAYATGEMASSKGIVMNDRKSAGLLSLSPAERPASVQIFGDNPEIMAQAAAKSLAYQPDAIDINMGCPVPKIAGNGGGSALMKQPLLAQKIISECVKAVHIPVTVKIRTGWDSDTINAAEMSGLCEQAGAALITVHGRTKVQMYAPPVDFETIKTVKKTVSVPVIGNGDIVDGISAAAMFNKTGCDLVMVGRGALGKPWVFSQINAFIKSGIVLPDPPVEERMKIMLKHIKKLCEYKGVYIGMREARKHAAWYMKGIRGAAHFRQEIGTLTSLEQLEDLTDRVIAGV